MLFVLQLSWVVNYLVPLAKTATEFMLPFITLLQLILVGTMNLVQPVVGLSDNNGCAGREANG